MGQENTTTETQEAADVSEPTEAANEESEAQTEETAPDPADPVDRVARAAAKMAEFDAEADEAESTEEKTEEAEEKEPAPEQTVTETEDQKPLSPQLAAIARRERQQKEAHETRLKELDDKSAEIDAKMAKVTEYEQAKLLAQSDPVALFEALGITDKLADTAMSLYAHELGDQAPAELQQFAGQTRTEARIRELEAKVDKQEKERQQQLQVQQNQQAFNAYRNSLRESVKTISEDHKHLRAVANHDAEGVADGLLEIAIRYAESDPQGQPKTAEELHVELEERLKQEFALLREIDGTPAPEETQTDETAEKTSKAAPKTLTSRTSAKTGKRGPAQTVDERKARAQAVLDREW